MSEHYVTTENILNENVVLEASKDFKESLYASVYSKAEALWQKIRENNGCSANEEKQNYAVARQFNNTISFEGRRGTGKTSAMLSFQKMLSQDNNNVVLEPIDASMMESGEDITKMVLGIMYAKFREMDEKNRKDAEADYESRRLYGLFEKVASQLNSIKRSRSESEESSLRILNRLSNSQMLRKAMADLVRKYLGYMVKGGSELEKRMLVVTVDDIDMNFQGENTSVFDILQSLHRYLMIPGVVILLTFDYPELVQGCQKHYYQMYAWHQIEDDFSVKLISERTDGSAIADSESPNYERRERQVKKISDAYLEKVVPAYARIHMPSQKKRDYDGIKVKVTSADMEIYFKDFKSAFKINKATSAIWNVKEFVFRLKASTLGIFYDGNGMKRHFAEPSNLRELAHVLTLCDQIRQKSLDEVYKELFDDLYFRDARVKLSQKEYDEFSKYLEVPIERRGQDILRDTWEDPGSKSLVGMAWSESKEKEDLIQSYGELLFGIYRASNRKNDNKPFKKAMICCILDSYTIMLTRLYTDMKKGDKKAKERFKKVLGSSVGSSWSNMIAPRLPVENQNKSGKTSQYGNSVNSYAAGAVRVNHEVSWDLTPLLSEENLEKRIMIFEYIFMFFTSVKNRGEKGFSVVYQDTSSREDRKKVEGIDPDATVEPSRPTLTVTFDEVCFNILNFVNCLFDGDEYFDRIEKNEGIKARIKILKPEQDVAEFFKNYSIREEYKSWAKESHGFAMPLYSFDMMYNIMKRQYQNNPRDMKIVEADEFVDELKKIYEEIGELLKKEDKFYWGENTKVFPFYNRFINSPFIKWFMNVGKGGVERECLNALFKSVYTWYRE